VSNSSQFIERTELLASNRKDASTVQDNPRRLGKSQIRLVGLAPLEVGASRGMEAGFTSSSGGVRASSVVAKQELRGEERLDTVPSRVNVVQVGFEPGRIAVTQRVNGCYCVPVRNANFWRWIKTPPYTKDVERRTKGVCEPGKLGGSAGRIFQESAIPNGTAGLW